MIEAILERCCAYPQFTFMFQSKHPVRYIRHNFKWPEKSILGTTIETDKWYPDIMGNAPKMELRSIALGMVHHQKFVTIEPILKFNLQAMAILLELADPDFVNIGAATKVSGLPEPTCREVLDLITVIENMGVPIRLKPNLERLMR